MIGIHVRLPKTTQRRMKALAAAHGKSLARLVSEDPFMKLIGFADSGHKDGSVNHDDIIYGR